MATALRQSTVWRDVKGNTAAVRYYVASSGTPASQQTAANAVAAAIIPVTNAALQSASGLLTSVAGPVVYGTAAQFATVEDKAVLTFSAADGTLHRYKIPAPKIDIFEVDQETVDNSQTDLAALVTAILANVHTADGAALTLFIAGVRTRVKNRRKLNIFLKVPELDEPAE